MISEPGKIIVNLGKSNLKSWNLGASWNLSTVWKIFLWNLSASWKIHNPNLWDLEILWYILDTQYPRIPLKIPTPTPARDHPSTSHPAPDHPPPASSIKHQASSIEHRAFSIKHDSQKLGGCADSVASNSSSPQREVVLEEGHNLQFVFACAIFCQMAKNVTS